jgi:glycosyltransferase involved in cell wall biosynthesis
MTTASVLMPVRDGARHLGPQLRALAGQDFTGDWELVVGDNGSTDGTRTVLESWRDRLPALTVVDAGTRPSVNAGRNAAARQATGDVFLFADADDEVTPTWISAMVEGLDRYELVGGPVELFDDRGRALEVLQAEGPQTSLGFLPFLVGGNLGVRRSAFELVDGFDETWPTVGAEEIDFCWRLHFAGVEVGFSDAIRVRYRQPATIREAVRKQHGYGRGSAHLSQRYADRGAHRWRRLDVARDVAALTRDLPWLLDDERRMAWAKRAGWVSGVARGVTARSAGRRARQP